MNKITSSMISICRYQSKLFEYSVTKNASSLLFIKKFVFSDIAYRMGSIAFLFESVDFPAAFDEATEKKVIRKGVIYSEKTMAWIGYMYRYICFLYNKPITVVYRHIKPQEFYNVYDAYHSMDPELAAKRILEAKNINFDKKIDLDLLKKIYNFD